MTARTPHRETGPQATVGDDGRVWLFVGAHYSLVTIDEAREFAQRIAAAIEDAERRIGAAR